MSELTHIARPYAKAAFQFAVERDALAPWQAMLDLAAEVTKNEQVQVLLAREDAREQSIGILLSVCEGHLDEFGQNLIKVMAENKRLSALPEVSAMFAELVAEHNRTAEVEVISATELTDEQKAEIAAKMEQRLARQVTLNCRIDASLIAGVVIRCGDLVIDGSVRGKLGRLTEQLQS